MNPPGLGEHRAEGEREAGHEHPGLDRADVAEGRLRGEGGVQPQDDHRGVAQEAANDDQVVQIWRRHLDLPEMIKRCTVFSQLIICSHVRRTVGQNCKISPKIAQLNFKIKPNHIPFPVSESLCSYDAFDVTSLLVNNISSISS